MTEKVKCKAEIESRHGAGVSWGDIRPCGRNAVAGSEYCSAHNPDKAVERAQKAYAKRHGLAYKAKSSPAKYSGHGIGDCYAVSASHLGKHGFPEAARFLYDCANAAIAKSTGAPK